MLFVLTLLLLQTPDATQTAKTQAALVQLADTLPAANTEATAAAIPGIMKAIGDPDPQTRTLGMLALNAVSPANHAALDPQAGAIAAHLTDAEPSVRSLTVLALGAFSPHPPPVVIPALLRTLEKADPMLGAAIVPALLALDVENHPESAAAILGFLHRAGLPATTAPRLVATIAHAKNHSAALDHGLLDFLGTSHPEAVRTALVSGLPLLRLTQAEVNGTRAQLTHLTVDPKEPAGLKSTAAGILPCWHTPRMTDACPALPMRYRMVSPPGTIPKPRYQSPPIRKDQSS